MYDGRTPPSDRRGTPFADADDPVVGAVALLVLGAGLGSVFGVPLLAAVEFWVLFTIGYAVVVPLVSLLRGRRDDGGDEASRDRQVDTERVADGAVRDDPDEGVDAALDRLRNRYATGELSEAQFERKLETLLQTETPEAARERLDREQDGPDAPGSDTERAFEREG
ncbi:hypothetical protein GCM10008995_28940 [Halobellus salinus]|uniref:SHOCT domain-containing protein n=1 Tax=Halobellus salinus TaxID=931585 RepID=A0A830ESG5_9EURY|nr:SHOCT domain-containing protein [Halobellus salinus]GGJ17360.1 hypothetical protein GCM10008995_28940 [Halobellus salinus]SMP35036.1 Short C-terminal domain-containing protein [Halobellus salinus]